MKKTINVILGAGFSYNADIPMANDIKAYFDRDNRLKVIRVESSELEWLRSSCNDKYCEINENQIADGYILNELKDAYVNYTKDFENYELFYSYVNESIDKSEIWLNSIFDNAYAKIINEHSNFNEELFNSQCSKVGKYLRGMIIELISDLLNSPKMLEEYKDCYYDFFKMLSEYEKVNIFTLNHDLLLEDLMLHYKLDYTDGFSKIDSEIFHGDSSQRYFNNSFDLEGIRIFKLHGSKDIVDFQILKEEKFQSCHSGQSIYFKPDNFNAKHNAKRMDLNTNKIIQKYHPNITPFFVTGKDKKKTIDENLMYSPLFEHFIKEQFNAQDLMIIGYSFDKSDSHITDVIRRNINNYSGRIINVNPNSGTIKKAFPDNYKNFIQLHDVTEINKL